IALKEREEKIAEGKINQERRAEVADLLSAGKKDFKKKNYQKAKESFKQVLDIEHTNKQAQKYIAKINKYLEAESRKEAVVLKKVEEFSGVDLLFSQALEKYKSESYKEAVPLFEQVLIIDPDHQTAYEYLEKCYQNVDQLAVYDQQISKLIQEGKSYIKNGAYEEANQVFNKVLKIDPKNKKAKRYMASLKSRLFETKGAKIGDVSIKIPESKDVGFSMPIQELTKQEAKQIYQEALELYKRGEYKKALSEFEQLAQVNSKYQKSAKKKATLCLKKMKDIPLEKTEIDEKYQSALSYFDKAIYEKCIRLLLEVTDLSPKYKESKKYLKLSRERIKMLESLDEFEQIPLDTKK
ncbi:MAG: tetratricopeptide repeat protein, partial [Candidatus Saelkia tenebricola]|nr:tetratricopeptide repeat protein [Candidatus Saelkia tenebricola]